MLKHMHKLTVMVSIYESGEWIENRLNNLMECRSEDIEVWCVNANSPDPRDHEIPQRYPFRYVKLDKRITVYETWNYIIQNSKSEFITNANTDDIVAPNCYQKMMQEISRRPDYGFVYCSWNSTAIPNQKWSELKNFDPSGRPGQYNGNIQAAGVGHFPMWRRNLHDQLGLFDTQFKALADADWWARCYHVGKTKFLWLRENLGTYLWRNGENLWNRAVTKEEWGCYHTKLQKYMEGKLE